MGLKSSLMEEMCIEFLQTPNLELNCAAFEVILWLCKVKLDPYGVTWTKMGAVYYFWVPAKRIQCSWKISYTEVMHTYKISAIGEKGIEWPTNRSGRFYSLCFPSSKKKILPYPVKSKLLAWICKVFCIQLCLQMSFNFPEDIKKIVKYLCLRTLH